MLNENVDKHRFLVLNRFCFDKSQVVLASPTLSKSPLWTFIQLLLMTAQRSGSCSFGVTNIYWWFVEKLLFPQINVTSLIIELMTFQILCWTLLTGLRKISRLLFHVNHFRFIFLRFVCLLVCLTYISLIRYIHVLVLNLKLSFKIVNIVVLTTDV